MSKVSEDIWIPKRKCTCSKDNLSLRQENDNVKQKAFKKYFLYQTRISQDKNKVN